MVRGADMNMIRITLAIVVTAALLQGCAPLVVAGAGVIGGSAWAYEYRSCKLPDGRWVNHRWANHHPHIAHCFR